MNLSPLTFAGVIVLTAIVSSALTAYCLRRRTAAAVRLPVQKPTPEPESPQERPPRTLLGPDFRPVGLVFGASKQSSPVMEISALRASALPHNKRRFDPAKTRLGTFSSFLHLIPSALTAADFGQDNYVQVLVHGPLALASAPESFLPFVRGARGRVEELAQLGNSHELRQLIGSGMGWQLAFITVAQKHLADIHKKLDYIKSGVEEIQGFLTNERRSRISGTLDYLRQVVATLGQKESPAAVRNQLEHIERELLQIQDYVMHDLEASTGKIGAIMHGRFERRTTRAKTIQQRADAIYELEKEWLLCMVARAINWQVLSVFPGDKQFKMTRKESIYKSIDQFTGLLERVYGQLYEKTAAVQSFLDSFSSGQQDKSLLVQFDLRRRLIDENKQISSDALVIREEVKQFANRLWSPQKPIMLALKLDRGRIVEAYEIEST